MVARGMQARQLGANRLIAVCNCLKNDADLWDFVCRVESYCLPLSCPFLFLFFNISLDIAIGFSLIFETHPKFYRQAVNHLILNKDYVFDIWAKA
jgi:hypothetical protein